MTNQTVGNKGICSNGESPVAAARALFFHVGSSPPPPPSPLSLPSGEKKGKAVRPPPPPLSPLPSSVRIQTPKGTVLHFESYK